MQWNQLDHYANNLHHINTQSLNFYRPDALPEAPTNSVKALKAIIIIMCSLLLLQTRTQAKYNHRHISKNNYRLAKRATTHTHYKQIIKKTAMPTEC